MHVLKFGGTSVSSKDSLFNIAEILSQKEIMDDPLLIVVSALKGVTNDLVYMLDLISKKNPEYSRVLVRIKQLHHNHIKSFLFHLEGESLKSALKPIEIDFENYVHRLFLKDSISCKEKDYVLGFGEIFSGHFLTEFLNTKGFNFKFLDTRGLIVTNDSFGAAEVNWELTAEKINCFFHKNNHSYVAAGYIGSTIDGDTTTLGRGGSDYTATIFSMVLNAKSLTKWTDSNGIMTADPNRVINAYSLKEITFDELAILSRFSSNVLVHLNAVRQLHKTSTPFFIRNTFNHTNPGTLVTKSSNSSSKIFSVRKNCYIVSLDKDFYISKEMYKKFLNGDYFFFRLKSNAYLEKGKFHYVVSEECLNFFDSEAYKLNNSLISFSRILNAEIVHRNVSIVTATSRKMNTKSEIEKIKIILASKGVYFSDWRSFNSAVSIILENSNVQKVLNLLHEELNDFQTIDA